MRWGGRVCPFVRVWLRAHMRVFKCVHIAHWKRQKEVKMHGGVCVWPVCVSAPTSECDLVVRRSQPLMTFACCRCEQSDPAALIKTNGTDRSPLIVFHWQMAPLTPEDCCRGPACLEHTDFTNENRRSVSVCASVCVCEREREAVWMYVCECERVCMWAFVCIVFVLPRCALACVKSETLLH